MAGWTVPDNETIEWDGTIKAKRLSIQNGVVTGDATTSGAAYIPSVVYNQTTSGGITASNYPIGSLLVVYS